MNNRSLAVSLARILTRPSAAMLSRARSTRGPLEAGSVREAARPGALRTRRALEIPTPFGWTETVSLYPTHVHGASLIGGEEVEAGFVIFQ